VRALLQDIARVFKDIYVLELFGLPKNYGDEIDNKEKYL